MPLNTSTPVTCSDFLIIEMPCHAHSSFVLEQFSLRQLSIPIGLCNVHWYAKFLYGVSELNEVQLTPGNLTLVMYMIYFLRLLHRLFNWS